MCGLSPPLAPMEAETSAGGLSPHTSPPPWVHSLAGRLEERLLIERLLCNDFHRLETFLAGIFETVQVLDADAKRCVRRAPPPCTAPAVPSVPESTAHDRVRCSACAHGVCCRTREEASRTKEENAKLKADLKVFDATVVSLQAALADSNQKMHAMQAALTTSAEQFSAMDARVSQGLMDTLERERNLDHKIDQVASDLSAQVDALQKRLPTSSELSAVRQNAKSRPPKNAAVDDTQRAEPQAEIEHRESAAEAYDDTSLRQAVTGLEQELRDELQKEVSDLHAAIDAKKMKHDAEMSMLRNEVEVQNKRIRYIDKISRTSCDHLVSHLPDAEKRKDLMSLLSDGLLEGKVEKDLIDEITNLRAQVGSIEDKLAKEQIRHEASTSTAAAEMKRQAAEEAAAAAASQVEAGKRELVETTARSDSSAHAEPFDQAKKTEALTEAGEQKFMKMMQENMTELKNRLVKALQPQIDDLKRETEARLDSMTNAIQRTAGRDDLHHPSGPSLPIPCMTSEADAIPTVEEMAKTETDVRSDGVCLETMEATLRAEIGRVSEGLRALEQFLYEDEKQISATTESPTGPKLTLKALDASLDLLRSSLNKQIGHERDARHEFERRIEHRFTETASHNDITLIANSACEAAELSKKSAKDLVDISSSLSRFIAETEDNLHKKADAKTLLQKAGWSEVRDLMRELSAHTNEKIRASSLELKSVRDKINILNGDTRRDTTGLLKCISCARPLPPGKPPHKAVIEPDLCDRPGGCEHVQRIKKTAAHLHAEKMPVIEGARQKTQATSPTSPTYEEGAPRAAVGGLRHRSPKRQPSVKGDSTGKFVPWSATPASEDELGLRSLS